MIIALGIDAIEIARFEGWATWPRKKLLRIFSDKEIDYCLSNPTKAAERFAARFAAKEAFYKTIHTIITDQKLPLFTVCRNVTLTHSCNGAPHLHLNEHYFKKYFDQLYTLHVSLTHTKTLAMAVVIIEKNK